jgi:acetate kinase
MKILVCNAGSTSLKFKLFEMPEEKLLCQAKVERVGSGTDAIYSYACPLNGYSSQLTGLSVPTYAEGIAMFLASVTDKEGGALTDIRDILAVGFKTVLAKGFYGVHELNEEVLRGMRDYLFVAPAHNGPYLEAIGYFRELLPAARLIGVFETAFHTTIPPERRMYSIPYEWYEKYGIMRMGYHGASHAYGAETLTGLYGGTRKTIRCHLGGSCSLCAIENGKSADTSFGFSLQTGIPHANRAGDIDPYIIPFLKNEGLSLEEILLGLSKNGGLLGVSGVSNDLRAVEAAAEEGNVRAKLAIDVFVNSIVRYIGAFYAELGGLDNLVFTGGIGENSVAVRRSVCVAVKHLGVRLDETENEKREGAIRVISEQGSLVRVLVIPANEEIGVARRTYEKVTVR